MDIVVGRREVNNLNNAWTLVYGRRKVGKTFMLRNFYNWDYYIHVGRDGIIWIDGYDINKFSNIEHFMEFIINALKRGKRIVVDEFQRLPKFVLERISTVHPKGTLILSGSSFRVVRDILDTRSPLLGFLRELPIGLIHPQDLLREISNRKDFLDYMVYLRDPWLIPMFEGKFILRDLYNVVIHVPHTIPSLIGEIFTEEDRKITSTYEGIIECVGSMNGNASQIASILYNRAIISKDSPSSVAPYIKNLVEMGIIKEVKIYRKKRSIYRMVSPIFSVFYYLWDKYDMEIHIPSFENMKENIARIHSICYEDFIVELLANVMGGYIRYSLVPEIDGIIVDRKENPIAVIEVKHGNITKGEISRFLDKCSEIPGKRIVIAKNKVEYENVISLTPEDIKKIVEKWSF